ncbi:MAG TPA: PDZ domain-containing protein [Burkholderiaceae bacterium]|nr:PDZ domain-containing protein [Burkholderiaceae bacterium]
MPALIARGRAPLPGIDFTPVQPDLVARAGISGVVLADVAKGSPAAVAGLLPLNQRTGDLGDVIIAANGKPVETLSQLIAEFERTGIDNTVELTVMRGERKRHVKVKIIDLRA